MSGQHAAEIPLLVPDQHLQMPTTAAHRGVGLDATPSWRTLKPKSYKTQSQISTSKRGKKIIDTNKMKRSTNDRRQECKKHATDELQDGDHEEDDMSGRGWAQATRHALKAAWRKCVGHPREVGA